MTSLSSHHLFSSSKKHDLHLGDHGRQVERALVSPVPYLGLCRQRPQASKVSPKTECKQPRLPELSCHWTSRPGGSIIHPDDDALEFDDDDLDFDFASFLASDCGSSKTESDSMLPNMLPSQGITELMGGGLHCSAVLGKYFQD